MSQETVLVVGATGTVGRDIVKELKKKGFRTKEATSKKSNQKEQVTLNLVTGEGIHEAFEGVERAFLLSPPGFTNQYELLSPLIQESKRRGLKKVVLMTAMGANADSSTPFRRAEIELEKSGLDYNIIRPNWFYQNFNTFWIEGILKQNKILLPAGQAKVSFIDARDIAEVAVKLLTTDQDKNKDFDLTGPQAVDHHQVAKALSDVTGKEIKYEEISSEQLLQSLLLAGLPKDYSEFLLMILGYLREGYNERKTDSVYKILGSSPRSLDQYVLDYKQNWL